jgi:hypothetical protein
VICNVAQYQLFTRAVLVRCQIECQIWVSEGSGGDRKSKDVSNLLILLILPAGSSPSLSTKYFQRLTHHAANLRTVLA